MAGTQLAAGDMKVTKTDTAPPSRNSQSGGGDRQQLNDPTNHEQQSNVRGVL